MNKILSKQTIKFNNNVYMISNYSIVGEKEGMGNFKDYYDYILDDDMFGEKTFEHAETKMIEHAVSGAINRSKINIDDIDIMFSGDLLNQITSSSFAARELNIPYLGLYGACSTMTEALLLGAITIDGGYANNVICVTGSHFSSAERQYRFPLELGNQRPPTSQWTVTGSGACVLSNIKKHNAIKITSATIGRVCDYGIKDVNNMGAAMAPAAAESLITHFRNMNSKPSDYDLILTGDLGKLGIELLMDLMEHEGCRLEENYNDCGQMIFDGEQKTYQGGSGAGCSAVILNSYVVDQMRKNKLKRVLIAATGALLSSTSSQQGDSIPGICHVVELIME